MVYYCSWFSFYFVDILIFGGGGFLGVFIERKGNVMILLNCKKMDFVIF